MTHSEDDDREYKSSAFIGFVHKSYKTSRSKNQTLVVMESKYTLTTF